MSNRSQIKIARYEAIIQNVINQAIINEIENKIIKHASVTSVKLLEDLSVAKIYLDCYDRNKIDATVKEIQRIQGFFRSKVASELQTYKTPTLVFVADKSIDYANNIEKLLKEINDNKENK